MEKENKIMTEEHKKTASLTLAEAETIIVTGGCGFIGSHFVEHLIRKTSWNIIVVDKLSYASNGLERLRDADLLENKRLRVFTLDLCNQLTEGVIKEFEDVSYIVHMAAETHIDNSIKDPLAVISNNVMSTVHLLEYARILTTRGCLKKFFYFSTDEVYGPAFNGIGYKETDRHNPTNPYSSSKSAGEQFCVAYRNTYKVPIVMVNVMNAFGERQHVEKFIPKCVKYIIEGRKLFIHADGTCSVPGSRFYIHARNISSAVLFLIEKGKVGELYHITGEKEVNNLEMAQFIAKELGKELIYELVNFHGDRPGHDLSYNLNGEKLFSLGFKLPVNFEESLRKTVRWTIEHPKWLEE
jgi:dTDP-glucose 4,6-dehydratase